jgi:hypothetical protein
MKIISKMSAIKQSMTRARSVLKPEANSKVLGPASLSRNSRSARLKIWGSPDYSRSIKSAENRIRKPKNRLDTEEVGQN